MPCPPIMFPLLHPLVDYGGMEGCGFLVRAADDTVTVWPVPSRTPAPDSYSIGRGQWFEAWRRAKAEGARVIGTVHTHPDGPDGPSERDLAIARRLPAHEWRAVYCPRRHTLTWYNRAGVQQRQQVRPPWWFRLLAHLLFRADA